MGQDHSGDCRAQCVSKCPGGLSDADGFGSMLIRPCLRDQRAPGGSFSANPQPQQKTKDSELDDRMRQPQQAVKMK